MEGFVITDAAAKMAQRLGVFLNQHQADAMRQRVAEIEASVQREADYWGLPFRLTARHRLEVLRGIAGANLSTSSTPPPMAVAAFGYSK